MIIRCTDCNSAYSVDDEKVKNKRFGFVCPKCTTNVIIDNRPGMAAAQAADSLQKQPETVTEQDNSSSKTATVAGVAAVAGAAVAGAAVAGAAAFGAGTVTQDTDAGKDDSASIGTSAGFDEEPDLAADSPFNEKTDNRFSFAEESLSGAETEGAASDFGLDNMSLPADDGFISETDSVMSDFNEEDMASLSDMEQGVSPDLLMKDPAAGSVEDDFNIDDMGLPVITGESNGDFEDDPIFDMSMVSSSASEDFSPVEEDITDTVKDTSADTLPDFNAANSLEMTDVAGFADLNADGFDDENAEMAFSEQTPLEESEIPSTPGDEDESITIDLNSLDLELDDNFDTSPQTDELPAFTAPANFDDSPIAETEIPDMAEMPAMEDLPVISDMPDMPAVSEMSEMSDMSDMSDMPEISSASGESSAEEDFDVTLDLASLDLSLEDNSEFKAGEAVPPESDERLSLDDAGLSLDEIPVAQHIAEHIADEPAAFEDDSAFTYEEEPSLQSSAPEEDFSFDVPQQEMPSIGGTSLSAVDDDEEELRLSLDEMDPSLSVDMLAANAATEEASPDFEMLADETVDDSIQPDDLPEVDLDRYAVPAAAAVGIGAVAGAAALYKTSHDDEEFLDIDAPSNESVPFDDSFDDFNEETTLADGRGVVDFSVDYSLSFSRIGAALRLVMLYPIALIPHIVLLAVYQALSSIVGFINWVLVLFTGNQENDFRKIQEQAMRYIIALNACASDVVEARPPYSGKNDANYELQLKIVAPVKHSRFLALMRISVIGILIITFPHLLLLAVLSIGAVPISICGLIGIIIKKRWPAVLFDFMVRYYRYSAHVLAFVNGLVDKYPPFRFD